MLPEKVRLPFHFDKSLLVNDLNKIYGDWTEHFVKDNYSGDWSVIPLRGPKGATHPILMIFSAPGVTEFEDTPFLANCEYFRQVIGTFKTKITSVRLMKLGAGSEIKEHRDYDLDEENGIVRLHVPVVTNDNVEFYLNKKRVIMKAGECWYCRLSDPHSVHNRGTEDRVHMVLDMELNGWLKDQLLPEAISE
ncbi:aspartyl beta-hydroxylase [Roseivirga seohaensis]|uniref:Aspartyl beta-hydroxylase n=1 Tax=Roseivirga seohaensis TaxID=1914963 RepID=A0A150Y499_9BACT|nr:aspartyl/asparaginyl beta-hydroxylase domain-containing protein [Roseivirga seohaensis]KYG85724.1 aspartyl beta-hydroxylase [Roseivirga seohaensis]